MVDFHSSRPGHDLRYGLDSKKIEKLGWKMPINFENSLHKTIQWTLENKNGLKNNVFLFQEDINYLKILQTITLLKKPKK